MSNVVNIVPPTVVENILDALNEKVSNEDELYVLRAYIDPETGQRNLEWYTTACESKIASLGALYFLAHKLMEDGGTYNEPEIDSA